MCESMTNLSTKALIVCNIKNRSAAEKESTPALHKKAGASGRKKENEICH